MTTRLPILGPLTRGECREWALDCRLTGCRYHLRHSDDASRANAKGEPWDGCSLDYADEGGMSQDGIATLMGLDKRTVQVIEYRALRKLAIAARRLRGETWETPGHWSDTEEGGA